jgi:hypothetical protein
VEAQRAELLATGILRVLPGELTAAGVDVRIEKDAGDEQDARDQRRDNESDAAKGKRRVQ